MHFLTRKSFFRNGISVLNVNNDNFMMRIYVTFFETYHRVGK